MKTRTISSSLHVRPSWRSGVAPRGLKLSASIKWLATGCAVESRRESLGLSSLVSPLGKDTLPERADSPTANADDNPAFETTHKIFAEV